MTRITNDLLDNAIKEQVRESLRDGYMAAGAPRQHACELADLCIHSVDEAMKALDRVSRTAERPSDELSVFLTSMQVMQGILEGNIALFKAGVAGVPGFNSVQHSFNIGGEPN